MGSGEPAETPGATLPAAGQFTETETREREVEGELVESSKMVRTKVFYLQSGQEAMSSSPWTNGTA